MRAETITRTKLTASEGNVLTNGDIFGTEIFLSEGVSAESFYEITSTEYRKLLTQKTLEAAKAAREAMYRDMEAAAANEPEEVI